MRPPGYRETTAGDVERLRTMASMGTSLTRASRELRMSAGWVWVLNRRLDLGFQIRGEKMPRNPKKAVGPRPAWTKTEIDDLVLLRQTLGLPIWAIERLMPGRSKISIKSMIQRMGWRRRSPIFSTIRDEIDAARMEARSVPPFRPPPVETLVIETW